MEGEGERESEGGEESESGRGRKGTEPAQREGRPDQIASNELRVKQGETEGKERRQRNSVLAGQNPVLGIQGGRTKSHRASGNSRAQSGLESIRTAGAHGDTGIYATGQLLT